MRKRPQERHREIPQEESRERYHKRRAERDTTRGEQREIPQEESRERYHKRRAERDTTRGEQRERERERECRFLRSIPWEDNKKAHLWYFKEECFSKGEKDS